MLEKEQICGYINTHICMHAEAKHKHCLPFKFLAQILIFPRGTNARKKLHNTLRIPKKEGGLSASVSALVACSNVWGNLGAGHL